MSEQGHRLDRSTPPSTIDPDVVLANLDWATPDMPDAAAAEQKSRVWLLGEIALEPLDTPSQGRPFANWARSRLSYHIGNEPPEGYTSVTYRQLKRPPDTEW